MCDRPGCRISGKIAKTHSGVRSEFARLAKDHPQLDRSFTAFLAQAYNLKALADYGVGSDVGVNLADVDDAIVQAIRFVDGVEVALAKS